MNDIDLIEKRGRGKFTKENYGESSSKAKKAGSRAYDNRKKNRL